ncbi:MAG: hypothetical protein M1541_07650 [Acidobacteria bacterium]|nr:hypothetical protein [Acidobacteriota bacterium]
MISLPGGQVEGEVHAGERAGTVHVRLDERALGVSFPLFLEDGQFVIIGALVDHGVESLFFRVAVRRPAGEFVAHGGRDRHGLRASVERKSLGRSGLCDQTGAGQGGGARLHDLAAGSLGLMSSICGHGGNLPFH